MSAQEAVEAALREDAREFARKPKALRAGSRLRVIAPASPGDQEPEERGLVELERLGFVVDRRSVAPTVFF
jgi:hypothetical protein